MNMNLTPWVESSLTLLKVIRVGGVLWPSSRMAAYSSGAGKIRQHSSSQARKMATFGMSKKCGGDTK